MEKPPDVTFDTITPDSLRSEKGLLKVQIDDNQPWQEMLKIAKSKSRTDKMQF